MAKYNWRELTPEALQEIANNSESKAGMLRSVGLSVSGGNNSTLNLYIAKLGVDVSNQKGKAWASGKARGRSASASKKAYDRYIGNPRHVPTSSVRRFLLKEGLIVYSCHMCGNDGFWMGEKLSLDLHHRDGCKWNNTLNNLVFLCPNCHRQTDNFGSKNR